MTSLARRILSGLCTAFLIGISSLGAANAATAPLRLDNTVTVDSTLASYNEVRPFTDTVKDLSRELGINIYVVVIDSPRGDIESWASSTTSQNNMRAGHDALVTIALKSREMAIDSLQYLSRNEHERILERGLYPALSSNPINWEQAGYDFYTVFEQTWKNHSSSNRSASAASSQGAGIHPFFVVGPLIVVAVGGGLILFFVSRKKRRNGSNNGAPTLAGNQQMQVTREQLETLNQQSHHALIQTDRSFKQASSAFDDAQNEFGPDALSDYRRALEQVQTLLQQAFGLRQELDDAFPETAQQQHSMLVSILEHCDQAAQILNANGERFSEMRGILGEPEPRLDALTQRVVAARARIAPSQTKMEELVARFGTDPIGYWANNVAAAEDNIKEAEKLIEHGRLIVRERITERGNVVPAIIQAEDFMRQAEDLLNAIDHADESITYAQLNQNRVKDELSATVGEVEKYLASQQHNGGKVDLSQVQQALTNAQASLAYFADHAATDPARSYQMLVSANTGLETALIESRSELSTKERQEETLNQALIAARSQVQAAYDAITTRANFVQSTARTRLSEAQGHLATAERLAPTDHLQALQEAQAAVNFAQQALQAAQKDENDYLMMSSGNYGSGNFARGMLVGSVLNNNRAMRPSPLESISTAIWGLGQIASLFNRGSGGGSFNFRIGGDNNGGSGPTSMKF